MTGSFKFFASAGVLLVFMVCPSLGGTVFYDDFESHTDVATSWVDGGDRDPGAASLGTWTIRESPDANRVQVMRSPVQSSAYVFDTIYGDQFLHLWRDSGGTSEAWGGISSADQASIATNGSMRFEIDVHNIEGYDGWGGNIGISAFDSAPGEYGARAFDVAFRAVNGGTVITYDGTSVEQTTLSGVFDSNTWEHVIVDCDFINDRWSVTIGGVTVSDLPFAGGDLSKVQNILLSAWDFSGTAGRGGFDNVELMTPVPEPSSLMFLFTALLTAGCIGWRRKF